MLMRLKESGPRSAIASLGQYLFRSMSHKYHPRELKSQYFSILDSSLVESDPVSSASVKEISKATKVDNSKETSGDREHQNPSLLIELARTITRETEKLDAWLKESKAPQLDFSVDSPQTFPLLGEEIEKSRAKIIKSTEELGALVMGPSDSMRWMAWGHNNSLSLHAIYHYKIAKSFPIHGTASFAQIAERVGLSELNVRRFLRHAMTNRIFKESEPGMVAHTAMSRLLAENSKMNDWVGFCVEEMWQAASKTISALNRNPEADDPRQTGFCLSNSTSDVETMFTTFAKSPYRSARMGGAMHSLTNGPGYELTYLLSSYDWASLNACHGTVVDIGGSHGFVSIALASEYPQLKFIVQDTPSTIASAPPLSDDLACRVSFQVHDFHTLQPVKGADIYFFRWILHNHSDRFAIPMLRNLIPALKNGARVLINDNCLPGPSKITTNPSLVDVAEEKKLRSMDLSMLSLLNSQERDEDGFRHLFKAADNRFRFGGIRTIAGSHMALIEAIWEGQDYCDDYPQ
ncbi:O-methyltransferase gsfB [Golovinomyces cichoracearum]|uniref:O-methyltransferase gsfB n=1 Tax=Golovinomyces cichoracearum TaxID=62708 RepID=A0A420HSH7_9PEZI|nr:O-methyltransferase gsfB [Golovinomyces cichoracearum]